MVRKIRYSWNLSIGTDVYTGSRPTYTQHMFACLCICWFRVRLLWVLEIAMDCSRHDRWNHPIKVHLTFSQTQLVELVTWQVQYIKRPGVHASTQCKQEAANSLPALKPWHFYIRLSHLQSSQSTKTFMLSTIVMWPVQQIMFAWWQNSSKCVYFS